MWMTREEIAKYLGIVPNSVRGKVQKGQIERKIENGKNLYRLVGEAPAPQVQEVVSEPAPPKIAPAEQVLTEEKRPEKIERPVAPQPEFRPAPPPTEPRRVSPDKQGPFNPKQVLLDILASIKVDRNRIDAIEKGDEIDLATGEISRELDAKITMRQHRQIKEIEEALERIKHGEYGTCEDCGEAIPEQRLRLYPAARLCVRCQEEFDHFEKLKDNQGLRGSVWREDVAEGGYSKSFED
jgi:DnaK suppressor protein